MISPALVVIAFNRPEKVRALLNRLMGVKFRSVNLVVDAPRPEKYLEKSQVLQVISLLENHSWNCTVRKNYAKNNMGCKKRVTSGIEWAFKFEDDLIILEDDIVPDLSFFMFCSEMLDKYRTDQRIMHISGFNPLGECRDLKESYYFSKYPQIWGWATWKRAWQFYNYSVPDWLESRQAFLHQTYLKNTAKNWSLKLNRAHRGTLDTWDFQWLYAVVMNHGLCVTPKNNLVSNIGFDSSATHPTVKIRKRKTTSLAGEISFPIVHCTSMMNGAPYDLLFERSLDYHPYYFIKDFIYHELLFSQNFKKMSVIRKIL